MFVPLKQVKPKTFVIRNKRLIDRPTVQYNNKQSTLQLT